MRLLSFIILLSATLLLTQCSNAQKNQTMNTEHKNNPYYSRTDTTKLHVSNEEWKKVLPKAIHHIAREQGTEMAFTGKYWNSDQRGTYYCAVCGNPLFKSDAKFASSCGWPSFFKAIRPNSVIYKEDNSHGMQRIEVECG